MKPPSKPPSAMMSSSIFFADFWTPKKEELDNFNNLSQKINQYGIQLEHSGADHAIIIKDLKNKTITPKAFHDILLAHETEIKKWITKHYKKKDHNGNTVSEDIRNKNVADWFDFYMRTFVTDPT